MMNALDDYRAIGLASAGHIAAGDTIQLIVISGVNSGRKLLHFSPALSSKRLNQFYPGEGTGSVRRFIEVFAARTGVGYTVEGSARGIREGGWMMLFSVSASRQTNRKHWYQCGLRRHIDIDDVQDTLTLAILGAENLHGRARVRLDGWWRLDRQRRTCTIDASTKVGEDIARLFTGFLAGEFGEGAFTVRRAPIGSREKADA